jgi:hypothetical protein
MKFLTRFTIILAAVLILACSCSADYIVSGQRQVMERHAAGVSVSIGQLVYLDSSNSWQLAGSSNSAIGVVTVAASVWASPEVCSKAVVSGFSGLTPGASVYTGTSGAVATSGSQVVGFSTSASNVEFDIRPATSGTGGSSGLGTSVLTVGPGAQYSTVQAAVTAAVSGQTVLVSPGVAMTYTSKPGVIVTTVSPPQNPLVFPIGGKLNMASIIGVPLGASSRLTLLNIATGNTGIVRSIHIITDIQGVSIPWARADHYTLQITYDGAGSPQVNIPLASLVGLEMHGFVEATLPCCETRFFTIDTSTGLNFTLKYPIPYTNGIKIELVGDSGVTAGILSATGTMFFSGIQYQDILPQCWNSNLRLLIAHNSASVAASTTQTGTVTKTGTAVVGAGTSFTSAWIGKFVGTDTVTKDQRIVSVTNTTHMTTETADAMSSTAGENFYIGNYNQFLNVTGTGWIVAVYGGVLGDPGDMQEALTRFYVDGATSSSYQASGTEDFFGSAWNFATFMQHQDWGFLDADQTNISEAAGYRFFGEMPLRYTTSATGYEANTNSPADSTNPETQKWTTVYYAEQ